MTDYPAHAPDILAEEVDDDVCLYRSDTHEVLVLNSAAADVWRLADGATSPTDLVAALARSYGTSADVVGPEVRQVLQDLRDRGYLAEVGA